MAKTKGVTHADAHQDEEMHVTRTTPQGTQEAGVEKGHEQRDIKIRALINWFIGLTVFTALTIVAMIFFVAMLTSQDRAVKTRLSTPLYGRDLPKRMPELLPNPEQIRPGGRGYTLPWDHYRDFVKDESSQLAKVGLEDEFGRPALPVAAVADVRSEPAKGGIYRDEVRPSDSSGGIAPEIAILTK